MKIIWLVVGTISLILGVIGLFIPVFPTVPFIIVAGYCYARSSKKLYDWLLANKTFGPMIRNWQENGSVSRKTKIISTVSMAASLVIPLIFQWPIYMLVIQCVILGAITYYLWTRPEPSANQIAAAKVATRMARKGEPAPEIKSAPASSAKSTTSAPKTKAAPKDEAKTAKKIKTKG